MLFGIAAHLPEPTRNHTCADCEGKFHYKEGALIIDGDFYGWVCFSCHRRRKPKKEEGNVLQ